MHRLTSESSGQWAWACGGSFTVTPNRARQGRNHHKKDGSASICCILKRAGHGGRKVILFWAERSNFSFIRQRVIRQFCKTQILLGFYRDNCYQDGGLVAQKSRGQGTSYRDTLVEKATQSELRQGKQKERQRTQPRLAETTSRAW